MRRLGLAGAFAGLLLSFAAPAQAALGTPYSLGTDTELANTTTTAVVTTIADCPPGALAVVYASTTASNSFTSVADSANAGTWTFAVTTSSSTRTVFAFSILTNDLPVGGTITTTFGTNSGTRVMNAACVTGVQGPTASAKDVASFAETTSALASVTTPALTTPNEVIFMGLSVSSGGPDAAPAAPAGWTQLGSKISVPSSTAQYLYYKVVTGGAGSTVAYGDGVTTQALAASRQWRLIYGAFKEDGQSVKRPNLTLLGVGMP